ncbi:MAG TPA: hypothetical protein VH814_23100 [Steroidobacteraceae bacterium]|jgi:hypothetical protein
MRIAVTTALTTVLTMVAAIAWAQEPSPAQTKTEATQEAAPANSVDPAAPEQTTEQATEEATAEQATEEKAADESKAEEKAFKVPAGYRAKRVNGKLVYCAENVVSGSRFGKEKCRTEAQLRALERQKEAATMRQNQGTCPGATACVKN